MQLVGPEGGGRSIAQVNNYMQSMRSALPLSPTVQVLSFLDCTLNNDGFSIVNNLIEASFDETTNGEILNMQFMSKNIIHNDLMTTLCHRNVQVYIWMLPH